MHLEPIMVLVGKTISRVHKIFAVKLHLVKSNSPEVRLAPDQNDRRGGRVASDFRTPEINR